MEVKPKPIKGKVIRGDQLAGLEYGVPTANLDIRPELEYGVYAAHVIRNAETHNAVVCYGVGEPPKFEVHLFNVEENLVGEELEITIVEKVSELIDWQSKERMRQKIIHDLEMAKEILEN